MTVWEYGRIARDRMARKNGFIAAWRDGGFAGCQGANMED
jgi:hypothetical protein